MKLYLVEAKVKDADPEYWARTWVSSGAEASKTRTRYQEELNVPRKSSTVTEVEVDTRKEALIPFLNKLSNTTNGPLKFD